MFCIDVVTLILKVLLLVGIGLLLYKVGNDWTETKFRRTGEIAGQRVVIDSYDERSNRIGNNAEPDYLSSTADIAAGDSPLLGQALDTTEGLVQENGSLVPSGQGRFLTAEAVAAELIAGSWSTEDTRRPSQTAQPQRRENTAPSKTGKVSGKLNGAGNAYTVVNVASIAGELWIHKQDPWSYTVQYGTSTNLASMENFRSYFPDSENGVIFQFGSRNNPEPVYGLLNGNYKTVREAREVIAQMPAQLRQYNPWVRRMDQLQQVVPKQ